MKVFCLFLVLAVAAVNSKVIDINKHIDIGLAKTNDYLRQHRYTSVHVPQGSFGSHVSFSDSDVLGLDSLKRTDDCSLEIVNKNFTVDLHYGFGFFLQSFKSLRINDQDMSASIRIGDNSVRVHYTVSLTDDNCYVTLHDLLYERLAKVDFHSSRPEYDGIDLEEYFEKEVIPFLESKIDKSAVELALERFICKKRGLEISEHMPAVHQALLGEIFPSQL
ncbi:unnamed protein product [Nezara viridula]|uniref:Uncharacterized protein n=1 Tax=Nezara viridula TaxID=85310 RepID=A0A9P0HRW3_NEZVI|nr:unnamed protein product [Nezara viridula]